jgi:uncharacterized membrane protein YuzA (DUF378 family)
MRKLSAIIASIGALNWGLIAFFNFNLVSFLFGIDTVLTTLTYAVVGVAGLITLTMAIADASAGKTEMRRDSRYNNRPVTT